MSDPKNNKVFADMDMKEYTRRMQENKTKYPPKRSFFGGLGRFFLWWVNIGASFMGLDKENLLSHTETTTSSRNEHHHTSHSSGAAFRASHHAAPRKPTHEEMLIREMEYEAIKKMTDGKGDDDCKCK